MRLALGASPGAVLYGTLRSTLTMVLLGLAVGTAAAWGAGTFAERFVYGISPSDPASLVAAVLLLGVAALVAALVPALRVLRIDPVTVLRAE
jgi:putative ABC transport system permease protein